MRISDWSSDVCSSDLTDLGHTRRMLGHHADCIAGMRPWQALARREEHQLPAQASEFYSQLGRCQHQAGQYDAARLMFKRSLALRRDPLQNEADRKSTRLNSSH